MPLPVRTVQTIDAEMSRVAARRQVLIDARDRREKDMLNAMRDVERHQERIDAFAGELTALLDERVAAARAEAAGA